MSREAFLQRLRAAFLADLDEQLALMRDALLVLDREPGDAEALKGVFRAAHTLKGSARAASLPAIETAAHALEEELESHRSGEPLTPAHVTRLLRAADAFAAAGDRLRAGAEVTTLDLEGPAAEPVAVPASAGDLLRVGARQVDQLVAAAAQLLHVEIGVRELAGELDHPGLSLASRTLHRQVAELNALVQDLRTRPFRDAVESLPLTVRDVAALEHKQVRIEVSGQDVHADRAVLDGVREALLHLARNAVAHGVEVPAERSRAGKPAEACIRVSAELSGDNLLVRIEDDGRGIDIAALRDRVQARGTPGELADRELLDLLLHGGLSSRGSADAISGRGVGLDAARAALARVRGSLGVHTEPGAGTSFTLLTPLTLATLRALLVRSGQHLFAIPLSGVRHILRTPRTAVLPVQGRDTIDVLGQRTPLHTLAGLLGSVVTYAGDSAHLRALLIEVPERPRMALAVDELLGEDEVLVRRIDVATPLPAISGAALLASGALALVLDPAELIARAERPAVGPSLRPAETTVPQRLRVLVADDSITTRMLEQSMLEAAGYEVLTAVDGADAWRQLQQSGADLVVSDVEMPRMDGFEFCRTVRADARFEALPFVLVTSRESAADRTRGLEAGASAYVGKTNFEQQTLLDIVRELIG